MADPSGIGQAAQVVAQRRVAAGNSSASSSNSALSKAGSPRSLAACDPMAFARSMAHLCAMKRTAELTETQLEAWHAALGGFRPQVLNAAVIELVLTETRFPELGDLYRICRRRAIQRGDLQRPYSPNGDGKEEDIPTRDEIAGVAARLGLDV